MKKENKQLAASCRKSKLGRLALGDQTDPKGASKSSRWSQKKNTFKG